ncbi:hypothetical protein [Psychrobacillus faecigallinarum]|nr:hypothetical protein [Psychrobacillus faecigallinarum]
MVQEIVIDADLDSLEKRTNIMAILTLLLIIIVTFQSKSGQTF